MRIPVHRLLNLQSDALYAATLIGSADRQPVRTWLGTGIMDVNVRKDLLRQCAARCGIKDGRQPPRLADGKRACRGLDWYLELCEQDARARPGGREGFDIGPREPRVGAGIGDDAVLACSVENDDPGHRRCPDHLPHCRAVDAFGAPELHCLVTESVGAHARQQFASGAETRSSNSLVRALAAISEGKPGTSPTIQNATPYEPTT